MSTIFEDVKAGVGSKMGKFHIFDLRFQLAKFCFLFDQIHDYALDKGADETINYKEMNSIRDEVEECLLLLEKQAEPLTKAVSNLDDEGKSFVCVEKFLHYVKLLKNRNDDTWLKDAPI